MPQVRGSIPCVGMFVIVPETSAGVDFVYHLHSDAKSFGWDGKPRSIVKRGEVNHVLMYSAI